MIKSFLTYGVWGSLLILLLNSCASPNQVYKRLNNTDYNPFFTGLLVYDPVSKDTIIDFQSNKYFTPASTVKLFTLFTALETLDDSIATVEYFETKDTLFIRPLADPSFLHDSLPNNTLEFLRSKQKPISIVRDDFEDFVYGDGWQWDDYPYYYMPEKSLFPLYGNVTVLEESKIIPSYFQKDLKTVLESHPHRDFYSNTFYYNPKRLSKHRKIPYRTSLELSAKLLEDTLKLPVRLTSNKNYDFKPHISTPTLPIYNRLMDESENYMAEQLFLIISKQKTGSYKVKNTIDWSLENLLYDLPQPVKWVDGSGLSRYNLFTPRTMVCLLEKIWKKLGKDNIKALLPSNGRTRALQKWYPFKNTYLYAKTGSVSNNHNICGFLETQQGRFLIFSYMNNNYMMRSREVRARINKNLQTIYYNY